MFRFVASSNLDARVAPCVVKFDTIFLLHTAISVSLWSSQLQRLHWWHAGVRWKVSCRPCDPPVLDLDCCLMAAFEALSAVIRAVLVAVQRVRGCGRRLP
jgi:hypothetical protein